MLFAAGWSLPTDVFRPLIALPWKRMKYRALCRRFAFRFYWGRDDYNADHIMRSQELRRIGGVSMGIMHGIPCISRRAHQMRHVDFDSYFVHGMDVAMSYSEKWPEGMRVQAIGTACLSRQELRTLGSSPTRDFVAIVSPSFHEDAIFAALRVVAERFPDRTIYLNVKHTYLVGRFGRKFRDLVASAGNIVHDEGRSYDRIVQCRYLLGETTTLVAEAVQMGRIAFAWDLDHRLKYHYYRRFAGLCVRSAEELCERVTNLETGKERYPRSEWGALIDLTGRMVWDRILADMRLRSAEPETLPQLAFVSSGNEDVASSEGVASARMSSISS